MSLRFVLLIIVAIALLHRAGMSSSLGGYGMCSISLAWVSVCLVC